MADSLFIARHGPGLGSLEMPAHDLPPARAERLRGLQLGIAEDPLGQHAGMRVGLAINRQKILDAGQHEGGTPIPQQRMQATVELVEELADRFFSLVEQSGTMAVEHDAPLAARGGDDMLLELLSWRLGG